MTLRTTEKARDASSVPEPPRGWDRLKWLGPGFLWMISAAGVWRIAFHAEGWRVVRLCTGVGDGRAVILKWFINREIGRFVVCRSLW